MPIKSERKAAFWQRPQQAHHLRTSALKQTQDGTWLPPAGQRQNDGVIMKTKFPTDNCKIPN
jgi:hypothetical protein